MKKYLFKKALVKPIGITRYFFMVFSDYRILIASLKLAFNAIRFFFLPQFSNTIFRTRPVISVDHELDNQIPFRKELVGIYLGFIKFWMNIVYWLFTIYGKKAKIERLVEILSRLYKDSGKIYLRYHSTTVRPKYVNDLRFSFIHSLDPHLNCVPSLHVTLVMMSWVLAFEIISGMKDTDNSFTKKWLDKQWDVAIRITESILFLKQHSLNCIGVSLFYLTNAFPELFNDDFCQMVINEIFTREGKDLEIRSLVRHEIYDLYKKLKNDSEKNPGKNWETIIIEFLEYYGFNNGSLNKHSRV